MHRLFLILTILTTYSKGTYHTECTVPVVASQTVTNQMIDRLIYEFQTNPDTLFTWAFMGMGQQGNEDKDAIVLVLNDIVYIPEQNYSRLLMDIVVPKFRRFRDVELESIVTDVFEGPVRHVRVDIYYAGNILKEAYGNFYVTPIDDNNCTLSIDINVRFGWFFNIFVSKKVYKNVIEWRANTFMENLQEMAETGKVSNKNPDISESEKIH